MKTTIALGLLLLASCLLAEDEKPSVEQLQAENALLKAQIVQMQIEASYEAQVCRQPDIMSARLGVIQAKQEADKAKQKQASDSHPNAK